MLRYLMVFLGLGFAACQGKHSTPIKSDNKQLAAVLQEYYDGRMQLFPLEATQNGVNTYNDKMPAEFTDGQIARVKTFYEKILHELKGFDRKELNENDGISYDFLDFYLPRMIRDLSFRYDLIPTDQMWGDHLKIGQWGSGEGVQPFQTVRDYDIWLGRLHEFTGWLDSAIVYFRKGVAEDHTLPKPLVRSLIPQFEYMLVQKPDSSLFFAPIRRMPATFSQPDRERLTKAYTAMIMDTLIPAYQRMTLFLKNEYLPAARASTTGISAFANGADHYTLLVQLETTTDKTPERIRELGYAEVKRIRTEMDSVKQQVGFTGTLAAFLEHVKNDPALMPYKSPEDVLNAFRKIQARITPNLPKYFNLSPKTPFEIRRTEAFRENSASAEYNQSPDGIQAGIFYVPIPDATKFNVTSGMESLFLHEAIPGHHYQQSLQAENESLPDFRRRNSLNNAYVEGWALYCESLGRDLGLYTDPYQRLGALSDEIHRAVRLVVDVSLHTGSMTREQAIAYMTSNETISEQGATAEIERYIAKPAQALSYKIGALKIAELRDKYQHILGDRFSISKFHDQLLKDGAMPLSVLEAKMDRWAASVKN